MLGVTGHTHCKTQLFAVLLGIGLGQIAQPRLMAQDGYAPPQQAVVTPGSFSRRTTIPVIESPIGDSTIDKIPVAKNPVAHFPIDVVNNSAPPRMLDGNTPAAADFERFPNTDGRPIDTGCPVLSCRECCRQPSSAVEVRHDDDVWLISTRHPTCKSAEDLCVHRYLHEVGFVPSSPEEYFALRQCGLTQSQVVLDREELCDQGKGSLECGYPIVTMYVHGNRVDSQTACDRGLLIYEHLARAATASQRLCHVIWSWPSDTIPGLFLADARLKAYKTHTQSVLLGDFLSRHREDAQVSLIGFSYGGRIILGAQHLLAGGDIFGQRLSLANCEASPRTRVAVWAPALPASWIAPMGLNGQATMSVERMLMYYNTRDPALRFYRKKLAESDTEALGFRGINPFALGAAAAWVDQRNAADLVGPHHRWTKYVSSHEVLQRTTACALWRSDDAATIR